MCVHSSLRKHIDGQENCGFNVATFLFVGEGKQFLFSVFSFSPSYLLVPENIDIELEGEPGVYCIRIPAIYVTYRDD